MNFLKKTILGFSTLCFFFPLWADDCPQLWGRFVCISDNFDKEPSYVLKIVQTGHGSQTTYVFNRPKTQTSWTHKVDERRLGRTYGGCNYDEFVDLFRGHVNHNQRVSHQGWEDLYDDVSYGRRKQGFVYYVFFKYIFFKRTPKR